MPGRLQIFSGNSNRMLAQEIADTLNINLGRAEVGVFENGETRVRLEDNVRGCDVFVVQPTCTPVNESIMELLILIDALRRASVFRVTAVIPYYGYAKQEKKTSGREPISAKLVANLIRTAGADRILTIDLHAPAIEGFFDIPVDHLQAAPLLADYVRGLHLPEIVIVSPDAGGVPRVNSFRQYIQSSRLAIIAKQRMGPDMTRVVEMVGDVAGKTVVIVDDMISTGSTLMGAVRILEERGANAIYACATHGVLTQEAITSILQSSLVQVIVTNTIAQPPANADARIQTISVAPLFAEAIMRIHKDLSLSVLFS
jgi:ribose-phosphate pyrophosphokinase